MMPCAASLLSTAGLNQSLVSYLIWHKVYLGEDVQVWSLKRDHGRHGLEAPGNELRRICDEMRV